MKTIINEYISAKNIINPPLLPVFISSVIQFDKFHHPVALYENYLICIFMNINENFSNEKKHGKTIVCKKLIRLKLNTKDISLWV